MTSRGHADKTLGRKMADFKTFSGEEEESAHSAMYIQYNTDRLLFLKCYNFAGGCLGKPRN